MSAPQARVPAGGPAGGQFATATRNEANVTLTPAHEADLAVEWSVEPDAAALADPGRAAQVADLLAGLDTVLATSPPRTPWISAPGFTCDGGALVVSLAATRLGIPNRPVVGLYWHTDVELRADLMGEYQGDETDEEWQANLDEIRDRMMDEHHHWVVLWPGTDHAAIFDPNAEIRNEPHLQNEAGTGALYQEIFDEWRTVAFDPDEDPRSEAEALYAGLVETVDAAVGAGEAPETERTVRRPPTSPA